MKNFEDQSIEKPVPPCQSACPIHQDIRGYLAAIARGEFEQAVKIIKETNPLPFICSTICSHPCENECRRKNVDDPLSIRSLKRAAMDFGNTQNHTSVLAKGDRVAVIGSGPSGLTAAHDLAAMGYTVTVFEKEALLGGALVHFIPLYRLPRSLITRDIDAINALGVEFKTNTALGRDFKIEDLTSQGYRAILLSTGLTISKSLSLPGFDANDVWPALPFLRDVNHNAKRIKPGKTVIVIGGGNVAIDVARSALRSGAAKVRMVCLESSEEMPAFPWEIQEAKEEGIEIHCSWGPRCVRDQDGLVCALETVGVRSVFDDQGRFNPTFCEDKSSVIEGDIIIVAIGQTADLSFNRDGNVQIKKNGQILFDPLTLATSAEGIFACGEVITGPGMAVEAMASGRQAALSIHRFLQGERLTDLEKLKPLEQLEECIISSIKRQDRRQVPLLDAKERIRNFDYIELGYSKENAFCESRRCLSCGAGARRVEEKCIDCLTCVRICPYGVPIVTQPPDNSVEIREDQCQACGICVVECPACAIEFNSSYFEDMHNGLEKALDQMALEKADSPLVLFYCYYGAGIIPDMDSFLKSDLPFKMYAVKVPCVSKLGVSLFLKTFEKGANGILVLECTDNDCIYSKATLWQKRHIESTKKIIKELGLKQEQIEMLNSPEGGFMDLKERVTAFAQGIM